MKKTMRFMALAGVLCFGMAAEGFAQSEDVSYTDLPAGIYELDHAHASIVWKVSHLGLSDYTARFTDFDATYDFNPENPEASVVTVTIDPRSIETDYPNAEEKDFNAKLADGEEWFNSSEFPVIRFQSTKLELTGENTGVLTGDLSFLGVTKPLSLDVTLNGVMSEHPFAKKPVKGFSASGTLKRSDWGMTALVPNIGDEVELLIEAEFLKKDEQ